ncbi:MAG: acetyl-CoA carboxylase biotin carboxyl carrier protein subunit [Actinomycetota bacterium]
MRRSLRLQPCNDSPAVTVELETSPGGAFVLAAGADSLAGCVEVTPTGGLLRLEGRVEPFYTARVGGELHLWLAGHVYRFVVDAPESGGPTRAAAPGIASGEITAPMPGRVVQLHASPGARVTAGELLAVVESMKVQFNVPAPVDSTVAEVCCEVGRIVELGDVLVRLEPR